PGALDPVLLAQDRVARAGPVQMAADQLLGFFRWLAGTGFAAFLVWAGVEQPWLPEPAEVTPPLEGW
ncbi:hypothetical protein ABTZ98_33160, partial [Streptomyces bacillaris]